MQLQQIAINLLTNAIRYTESGTVRLSCQILPNNQWAIAVSDTRIGISPEERVTDFRSLFSSWDRETRVSDSTGLGLAIVSQIVKLMQGKIELVSPVGVGSTFTAILSLELTNQESVTRSSQ